MGPESIDELGHVNNARYFDLVEKAARAHAEFVGLTQEAMRSMGGAFLVRAHNATYYGEAGEGDLLRLRTWVDLISGPRCTRIVQVWKLGERIFEAKTDWVWVDPVNRSPKRIPPQVVKAFAAGL